jgi:hypothetical protein
MKKYSLGLIVFTLLFSLFSVFTANAGLLGCLPGDKYSRNTGELCNPTLVSACQTGEKYNAHTGESCLTSNQPSITLVSQSIATTASDAGDFATGTFRFKVYSPSKTIYVSKENPMSMVNSFSARGIIGNPTSASLDSDTYKDGDTSSHYMIEAGETRTFNFLFTFVANNGTGYYRGKATSLKLQDGSAIKFGSEFVTIYVMLTGNATIINTLKAYSSDIVGSQSNYTAGQTIKFSVKAIDSKWKPGIPANGFNVQANMLIGNEGVQINGVYQSFNAKYNYNTSYWDVAMTAPSDNSKIYTIKTSFYCSASNLGCLENQIDKSFNFKISPTTPPPAPTPVPSPVVNKSLPTGTLDQANCSAVAGWAIDWDAPNDPLRIQIFNGPAGETKSPIGDFYANLTRSDLNPGVGISKDHGFVWPLPASLKDGQSRNIYAYAVDAQDGTQSKLLNGSPKPVTCASAQAANASQGASSGGSFLGKLKFWNW